MLPRARPGPAFTSDHGFDTVHALYCDRPRWSSHPIVVRRPSLQLRR